jgi:hypothetical protein
MAVIRAAVYRNTVDSSLRQVGFRVAPELRTEYEFLRILEKQKRKETVAEKGNCGITLRHRALLLYVDSPGQK